MSILREPLTEAKANLVYDILEQHAAASEYWRNQFIQYMTDNSNGFPKEFRFQGSLGFGGKCYRDHAGKFYVQQYREDQTPESKKTIEKINEILRTL